MISFVVLNWNSGRYLWRTLNSIEGQSRNDFELIIVDNASTNESLQIIQHFERRGAKLIRLSRNLGFAGGMNAGIGEASGELVVALNSDACVASNFVEVVTERAAAERARDAQVGMFAVPLFDWHYGAEIDTLTDQMQNAGVTFVRRLTLATWHPGIDPAGTLLGPSGAAPIFTRKALDTARMHSGFVYDPAYFAYAEDIDLFLRLHALGFACVPCFDTRVWHIGSASFNGHLSLRSKPPAVQRQVHLNRWRTWSKIGPRSIRMGMLPWMMLDDLMRIALSRQPIATAKAFAANYRRFRSPLRQRYPARKPPIAGNLFSRSGWYAQRHGRLPNFVECAGSGS